MNPATPLSTNTTDERPAHISTSEQVKRNKWLRSCLSCSRFYECGAEKALLMWHKNKCVNFNKERT